MNSVNSATSGENEYMLQIGVLGGIASGRSQLINRYVNDTFVSNGYPHIGIDSSVVTKENFTAHILNLPYGQSKERFSSASKVHMACLGSALVVCDLTRETSFHDADETISKMRELNKKVEIFLVATKKDALEPETLQIRMQQVAELAQKYGIDHFATSARTGENVDSVFNTIISSAKKVLDSKISEEGLQQVNELVNPPTKKNLLKENGLPKLSLFNLGKILQNCTTSNVQLPEKTTLIWKKIFSYLQLLELPSINNVSRAFHLLVKEYLKENIPALIEENYLTGASFFNNSYKTLDENKNDQITALNQKILNRCYELGDLFKTLTIMKYFGKSFQNYYHNNIETVNNNKKIIKLLRENPTDKTSSISLEKLNHFLCWIFYTEPKLLEKYFYLCNYVVLEFLNSLSENDCRKIISNIHPYIKLFEEDKRVNFVLTLFHKNKFDAALEMLYYISPSMSEQSLKKLFCSHRYFYRKNGQEIFLPLFFCRIAGVEGFKKEWFNELQIDFNLLDLLCDPIEIRFLIFLIEDYLTKNSEHKINLLNGLKNVIIYIIENFYTNIHAQGVLKYWLEIFKKTVELTKDDAFQLTKDISLSLEKNIETKNLVLPFKQILSLLLPLSEDDQFHLAIQNSLESKYTEEINLSFELGSPSSDDDMEENGEEFYYDEDQ